MPEQSHKASQGTGCLKIIMLILSVYQILYASRVLIDSGINAEWSQFPLFLHIVFALVWTFLFIYVLWCLWTEQSKSIQYSAWLLICFILFRLLQTVMFVQADYDRNRIGFLIGVTLMILIVPILILLQQRQYGTHN